MAGSSKKNKTREKSEIAPDMARGEYLSPIFVTYPSSLFYSL